MEVHLTGFGVFQNVPFNPVEVLVREIKENYARAVENPQPKSFRLVSATVLKTAARASKESLCSVLASHGLCVCRDSASVHKAGSQPSCSRDTNRQNAFAGHIGDAVQTGKTRHGTSYLPDTRPVQHVILLHLGLDVNRPFFALEKQAWNDASFRIPDEEGWNPMRVRIRSEDGPTTHTRQTSLDLDHLSQALRARGFCVAVSRDPGRFVCNWVYYQSLCHVGDFAAHMGASSPLAATHNGHAVAATSNHNRVAASVQSTVAVDSDRVFGAAGKLRGGAIHVGDAKEHAGAVGEATLTRPHDVISPAAESSNSGEHDGEVLAAVDGANCHCRGHASPDVCVQMESLFVHMPAFDSIPKETQLEFVGALLEELAGILQ